jgi:hypothetical protein
VLIPLNPAVPGDADGDGDVDLLDFDIYLDCETGSEANDLPDGCEAFDFDQDQDIDREDFAVFQRVFQG